MIRNTLKLAAGSSLIALLALVACSEESSPSTETPDDTELSAGGSAGETSSEQPSNSAGTGGGSAEQPDDESPDEVELALTVPAEVLVRKGDEVSFEASVAGVKWANATLSLVDAPAELTLTRGADGILTIAAALDATEGDVEVTLRLESGERSLEKKLLLTVAGSPGSMDTSFASAGQLAFGGNGDALLVDAEGRLLALYTLPNNTSYVARVLSDGTLDPEFDEDGITNVSFIPSSTYNDSFTMVRLPNGDIAVTGRSGMGKGDALCLERFDSTGQRTGLDGDGRVCLQTGTYIMPFEGDSFLLSGTNFNAEPAVWKVTANGELDKTFGDGDGQAVWISPENDGARTPVPMGTGFLLPVDDGLQFSLVRYDRKGDLVTTFGTGGRIHFPGLTLSVVLPGLQGRTFLTSRTDTKHYAMVLDSTGNGDAGFGDGGLVDLTALNKFVYAVYPSDNVNELWLNAYDELGRVDANGVLDSSFGAGGYSDVAGGISAFAILPRGRVAVLTGTGTVIRIWR